MTERFIIVDAEMLKLWRQVLLNILIIIMAANMLKFWPNMLYIWWQICCGFPKSVQNMSTCIFKNMTTCVKIMFAW